MWGIHNYRLVATMAAFAGSPSRLISALSTKPAIQRRFQFIPYGSSAPNDITSIACDGRVPGATMEVTHWTGNSTPENLYADTSTEMALNLAKQTDDYPEFSSATVLNNHYDSDGVLSVWACTNPEKALEFEKLIVNGAEAGDFGEWSSDAGVKLDCALLALLTADEEQSYQKALEVLPELLHDITHVDGSKFEKLWKPGFSDALQGWSNLESGRAKLWRASPDIVVLEEADDGPPMSPYALHRGLVESNLWEGTHRILRTRKVGDSKFHYDYEKIGHGWVQKLVDRHMVPVVDKDTLVTMLNKHDSMSCWKAGGISGLVSICCSEAATETSPTEVVRLLTECDPGCT